MATRFVYAVFDWQGTISPNVFTSRVVAMDAAHAFKKGASVKEMLARDSDDLTDEEWEGTDWLWMKDGAITVNDLTDEGAQQLNLLHIEAGTGAFPRLVGLRRRNDGKLVTYVNDQEAFFGNYAKGCIAKPDNKWEHPAEGRYFVDIAGGNGNTIFLKEHYYELPAFNIELFKKWAWSALPASTEVVYIRSSRRGPYLAVYFAGCWNVVTMVSDTERIVMTPDGFVENDMQTYDVGYLTDIRTMLSGSELPVEKSYYSLRKLFKPSSFLEDFTKAYSHFWQREFGATRMISAELHRGISEGFISAWSHGKYPICTYRLEPTKAFQVQDHFSEYFLREMAEDFSKQNEKADIRLADLYS